MDHIERTRREFGQQAANFAASTAINDEDHVRRLVDPIGVAAQGRVLDVACGPGIVTVELARTARDVVALDLTPEMLNKARERCGKAARANVCFEEGTASALPFDDASFDAVVTRLSFQSLHRAKDGSRGNASSPEAFGTPRRGRHRDCRRPGAG
jgi:SAM-dependent methyltransferase